MLNENRPCLRDIIYNLEKSDNWQFPDCIKSEKATVNAKNNVGKYFQYAAILELDLKGIESFMNEVVVGSNPVAVT